MVALLTKRQSGWTFSFLFRLSPLFGALEGRGRKQTYLWYASLRKHPQYLFITFGEVIDSSCSQEDEEIILSLPVTSIVNLNIYWFRSHSLKGKRKQEAVRRPQVLPCGLWPLTESLLWLDLCEVLGWNLYQNCWPLLEVKKPHRNCQVYSLKYGNSFAAVLWQETDTLADEADLNTILDCSSFKKKVHLRISQIGWTLLQYQPNYYLKATQWAIYIYVSKAGKQFLAPSYWWRILGDDSKDCRWSKDLFDLVLAHQFFPATFTQPIQIHGYAVLF